MARESHESAANLSRISSQRGDGGRGNSSARSPTLDSCEQTTTRLQGLLKVLPRTRSDLSSPLAAVWGSRRLAGPNLKALRRTGPALVWLAHAAQLTARRLERTRQSDAA